MNIKKHKKKIIGGLIGFVFLLLVIILVATGNKKTVEQYQVGMQDLAERVEIAGTVEADSFAELGFESSGRVSSVLVKVGDEVTTGQVLARLDAGALSADLRDAEASLAIAQTNLENDTTTLADIQAQQDVLVSTAYRTLLSSGIEAVPTSTTTTLTPPIITGTYRGNREGQYRVEIERGATSNDYVVEIFGLEKWKGELEENQATPLGSDGLFIYIPGKISDYFSSKWIIDIPNTRSTSYLVNKNAYEQALENRDVALQEAERSLSQGSLGSSVAEAQVQQAQARVDRIRSQIGDHIIRAPFSGVVTSLDLEVGEIATSSQKVVSVISRDAFEVNLEVPEIDVSKLEVGNEVVIMLDAFDGDVTWSGIIDTISQAETYVDGVPVYETRVLFTDQDDRIRSGMTATVSVITEEKSQVIAVPKEYVQRDVDGFFVWYVATDERGEIKTERRDIKIGLTSFDGFTEIREGLIENDAIVLDEI